MLKGFISRLFGSPRKPAHLYGLYVQCDQCGEKIHTHINLHSDLSIQYGKTDKENVYFVRKQLLGRELCFNPINVELTFDNKRILIDQQISGGRFITEDEFSTEPHDQQPHPSS